jgi:hypothetical protein
MDSDSSEWMSIATGTPMTTRPGSRRGLAGCMTTAAGTTRVS